jgi:polysaccharide biosynthesis protein PslH
MAQGPRALFLTPYVPYPVAGGGSLRTASVLEYVARRYRTDVLVFHAGPGDLHGLFPAGLVKSVSTIPLQRHWTVKVPYRLRDWAKALGALPPLYRSFQDREREIAAAIGVREYDLCVIEHSCCAHYLDTVRSRCRRTVLDLHNLDSLLLDRSAGAASGIAKAANRRWAAAARRWEARWLDRFDDVLVTSDIEARHTSTAAPKCKVRVVPNTIPARPMPQKCEENAIIFSGDMAYQPNIAAARFFRDRIWPVVAGRFPGIVWRIVGRNPDAVREYLEGDARIHIVGPVDDAVRHLANARVAVVPLLSGGGTRLKILEAWAAGTPVVSTSVGAEGLGCRHGEHALIADSAEEFAGAVAALMENPETRTRIATTARDLFETEFTWETAWKKLAAIGL